MRTERAFTLVEIVVTVVVLSILVGVAVTRFSGFFVQPGRQVQLLESHLIRIQQASMQSRQRCGIRFSTENPGYKAIVHSSASWSPFATQPIEESLSFDSVTLSISGREFFFSDRGQPVQADGTPFGQDITITLVAGEYSDSLVLDAVTGSVVR